MRNETAMQIGARRAMGHPAHAALLIQQAQAMRAQAMRDMARAAWRGLRGFLSGLRPASQAHPAR